ncbi:Transposon Ty4-J Gag-Pol polyprotein, partial [Durusdinium trenchii]
PEDREPPKAPYPTFAWCVCRHPDGRFLRLRRSGLGCCPLVRDPRDKAKKYSVASYEHVVELRKIIVDLKHAKQDESLEEPAALLLRLPEKMEEINAKLCHKLRNIRLPSLPPSSAAMTSLFVPTPHNMKAYVQRNVVAMSGDSMGHFYAKKGCPWLDAVPFGVIYDATSIMDLQIACHPDIVPISVKMMISKGCPVISDYTPQRGAVPLYEFCELQTLLLREVDDMSLKELQFRTPQGPIRFYELELLRLNTIETLIQHSVQGYPLRIIVFLLLLVNEPAGISGVGVLSVNVEEASSEGKFGIPRFGGEPDFNKRDWKHRNGKGSSRSYAAVEDDDNAIPWELQSQSLAGFTEDIGDLSEWPDDDEAYHSVTEDGDGFMAEYMGWYMEDGLDMENDEACAMAAEVLQLEYEAYNVRSNAKGKGHGGFAGQRHFEVSGSLSLQEKRARLQQLKLKTECRRCGQKGHWSGDRECPKSSGKGKRSGTTSTASTSASSFKGKKGKDGSPKTRVVYFAMHDDEGPPPDQTEDVCNMVMHLSSTPPRASTRASTGPSSSAPMASIEATQQMVQSLYDRGWTADQVLELMLKVPEPPSTLAVEAPPSGHKAPWPLPHGHPPAVHLPVTVVDQVLSTLQDMDVEEEEHEQARVPLLPGSSAAPSSVDTNLTAAPSTPEQDLCPHTRITKKGTNGYYYMETCLDCNKVLKREKKTGASTVSPTPEGYIKEPAFCRHNRVTWRGSNGINWRNVCLDCGKVTKGRWDDKTFPGTGVHGRPPLPAHRDFLQGAIGQPVTDDKFFSITTIQEIVRSAVIVGAIRAKENNGVLGLEELHRIIDATAVNIDLFGYIHEPRPTSDAPAEPPKTPPRTPQRTMPMAGSPSISTTTPERDQLNIWGQKLITFGKHKGQPYWYAWQDSEYVRWCLSQSAPSSGMKDLLSYLREKQRLENDPTGYMAVHDPTLPEDGPEANETWMIAILDSGCNRTCHGDRWMERYMKATNQSLTDSPIRQGTCSIKGINGSVSTQGLRRLEVCFELEDAAGAFAVGTLDSTELSNSDAPLLLSIRDQRRLQLQLDLTGDTSTVYSKLFGGNIKVTEVNGLLGLHLLPSHLALLAGHENADTVHEKLTLPDEFFEYAETFDLAGEDNASLSPTTEPTTAPSSPTASPSPRAPTSSCCEVHLDMGKESIKTLSKGQKKQLKDDIHELEQKDQCLWGKIVRQRLQRGRKVLIENPWTSALWDTYSVRQLMAENLFDAETLESLELVRCDQCQFGLRDWDNHMPHKKPTGFMTASEPVKTRLHRLCDQLHEHQVLEGGQRTKRAQEWPEPLCRAMLDGFLEELNNRTLMASFYTEDIQERSAELDMGLLDSLVDEKDMVPRQDLRPHRLNQAEMERQELMEENPPPTESAEMEREQERRMRWLKIPRPTRLALRRLHNMTGHSPVSNMIQLLRTACATPAVIEACKHFACESCRKHMKVEKPNVTKMPGKPVYAKQLLELRPSRKRAREAMRDSHQDHNPFADDYQLGSWQDDGEHQPGYVEIPSVTGPAADMEAEADDGYTPSVAPPGIAELPTVEEEPMHPEEALPAQAPFNRIGTEEPEGEHIPDTPLQRPVPHQETPLQQAMHRSLDQLDGHAIRPPPGLHAAIYVEPQRRKQLSAAAKPSEISQLRSVVGSLSWLGRICRPDICFRVNQLQAVQQRAQVRHLIEANKLLNFAMQDRDKGLFYARKAMKLEEATIVSVTDASFGQSLEDVNGNLTGHRSQTGRILLLANDDFETTGSGVVYPLEWQEVWRAMGEKIGNPTYAEKIPDNAPTKVKWIATSTMVADALTKAMKAPQLDKLMADGVLHRAIVSGADLGPDAAAMRRPEADVFGLLRLMVDSHGTLRAVFLAEPEDAAAEPKSVPDWESVGAMWVDATWRLGSRGRSSATKRIGHAAVSNRLRLGS